MNEIKWEVYLRNGRDEEIINIKNLTEEQRRKLDQRLNEQCAAAVTIHGSGTRTSCAFRENMIQE